MNLYLNLITYLSDLISRVIIAKDIVAIENLIALKSI